MRPTVRRPPLLRAGAGLAVAAVLLSACTGREGDHRRAAGESQVQPWFADVTEAAGIDFRHEPGARGALHLPEITGAGAALFDYDGDGDLDVYLVNGGPLYGAPPDVAPAPNRLYRQEPGMRFTDVTAASGLGDTGYGMGVAVGDVDNDGRADVYVSNFGADRLYRNLGDGTFRLWPEALPQLPDGWSASAVFLDYDRDGWLDLFVTQYVAYDPDKPCRDEAGRAEYCGPTAFAPVPDILLHNVGDGTFEDVTARSGIGEASAAGLGVVSDDFDGDGWPDLYVANDAYANHLWINQHDGTFGEAGMMLGVAFNLHGNPEAGMGVVAEDLDNDGSIDLFVTNLSQETNTFYRRLPETQGWSDVTGQAGLGTTSMLFTGFGTAALDLEFDGDLDLIVGNGRVTRAEAVPDGAPEEPWGSYAERNLVYLNNGGRGFESIEAPLFTTPVEITRGLAVGDVDGDGDADVLINNVNGPARLYRNDVPRHGHWLAVRALDPRLSRDAIGARVTVETASARRVRQVTRTYGYLSSNEPVVRFGLGADDRVEAIEVRWPDGLEERFGEVAADGVIELLRGSGEPVP